jgi:hypothetical protein
MWTLLLTMHNTPERQAMYEDVVGYYQARQVPVYLVDSANRGIASVPREHQVLFDQHAQPEAAHCTTSTHWELLALQRFVASPVCAQLPCRYLVKLTAKYKLPELQSVLDQQVGRFSPHLFVQHLQLGGQQNCEIVGFARARLPAQLQALQGLPGFLEQRLHQLLQSAVARRLPRLRNTAPYKRAAGNHLAYL